MKGDLIERDDVLKEIWEWIANREYQYTNATHWLQKRIEAIPCAEDNADRKTENSSEKPNNCEHITEDGVTCAKYPACDDCLDNPLNKVKGSERLLKGKTEPTISKMEQVDKDINVRSKDEPQTADCPFDDDAIPCEWVCTEYGKCKYKPKDEPQQQTCSFSDCDNFKNPDYERCIECKRKQIKLKTEQTERSE